MGSPPLSAGDVARYDADGFRLYRITMEAFPDFLVHAFVLLGAGPPTLIDTGSGFGACDSQLLQGLREVGDLHGENLGIADIGRILITHGHIDHFGGLASMLARTEAAVGIHELDRGVLVANHERVAEAKHGLRIFLNMAGVRAERRQELMQMYEFSKQEISTIAVDIDLHEGLDLDGLRFVHVPGHCPGQVCIEVGDILLAADHILSRTSPHQSPESIMAHTGLGHYLASLDIIATRASNYRLALGGHEHEITDIAGRINEIKSGHQRKLDKIVAAVSDLGRPMTIRELTARLYPRVSGFHELLALEEIGAHVEYLHQRARLRVANADEIAEEGVVPFEFLVP